MTRPTRALIADDHAPTRHSVAETLAGAGFEVCATVPDARSAIAAAEEHHPDVALLDIHMPGNGIAAAAEIAVVSPDTTVVMLTVSLGDEDLFNALRVGAAGYLLKDLDPTRLADAIRSILRGEAILPRALLARIGEEFRARARPWRSGARGANLSSREWEVLALLTEGSTTAEIAQRLYIGKVTVRSHVAAIVRKLRVETREEAIRLVRGE